MVVKVLLNNVNFKRCEILIKNLFLILILTIINYNNFFLLSKFWNYNNLYSIFNIRLAIISEGDEKKIINWIHGI